MLSLFEKYRIWAEFSNDNDILKTNANNLLFFVGFWELANFCMAHMEYRVIGLI